MNNAKCKMQNAKYKAVSSPILIFAFCILHFAFSVASSFAETTIRVLLLDGKNQRLPYKDEKIERLGNTKGDVMLGGLKYPGTIDVWKGEGGLFIVNEVSLEDYIKGVVAAEVGSKWDAEALKAQAVAARTYALYQKLSNGVNKIAYNVTSSVLHQVYKGGDIPETIRRAVDETKGEILTYEGSPIAAYYHSTSGGITEDAAEVFGKSYPYLISVETSCELSPYYMWEKRMPVSDIEKALNMNGLRDIFIDSYTDSNRVRTFKIITDAGEFDMPGKDFRKSLGWDKLPGTMITNLTRNGNIYIFEGKGFGHGVGMCQWAALELAKEGKSYREILSTFYPGTTLEVYENR